MFAFLGKWQTPSKIARKALRAKAKKNLGTQCSALAKTLLLIARFFCPQFVVWKWMGWRNCEKSPHHSFHFVNVIALILHTHTQIYC